MNPFEAIIKQCTKPLKDDTELQRKVALELESHLDAGTEEFLSKGESQEEAEKHAVQAFGDPEVIGQKLLFANFFRLKRRARIRLAIKVLLIPALLIAFLLTIDVRSLVVVSNLNPALSSSFLTSFVSFSKRGRQDIRDVEFPPDKAKKTYEEHIDDPVYRINYLLSFYARKDWKNDPEKRAYLTLELKRARELEPDNACFSYLLADIELSDAVKVQSNGTKQPPTIQILNPEAFERGMAEVKRGLTQKYLKTYFAEILQLKLGPYKPDKDLIDVIQEFSISAGMFIHSLQPISKLPYLMAYYGNQRARANDPASADLFLNGYKTLGKQVNENACTLVEVLKISGYASDMGKILPEIYNSLNRPDLAQEAEQQLAIMKQPRLDFKASLDKYSENNRKMLVERAGILTSLFTPMFGAPITGEDLRPELKVSYNLVDATVLAIAGTAATLLILFVLFMWLVFRRKNCYIILLSGKESAKYLLWGIICPLLIFLLITRIDVISGRDYSLQVNNIRLIIQYVYLLLLMPLWSICYYLRLLRRHYRKANGSKLPFNLGLGNLIPALVVLLLFTGGILRPLLRAEQKHYIRQEGHILWKENENPTNFTRSEALAVEELKKRNREALNEILKHPVKLEP